MVSAAMVFLKNEADRQIFTVVEDAMWLTYGLIRHGRFNPADRAALEGLKKTLESLDSAHWLLRLKASQTVELCLDVTYDAEYDEYLDVDTNIHTLEGMEAELLWAARCAACGAQSVSECHKVA